MCTKWHTFSSDGQLATFERRGRMVANKNGKKPAVSQQNGKGVTPP